MLKLLVLLIAGTAIGVIASWVIFKSLRDRVGIYEAYLHERIDSRFQETLAGAARRPELILQHPGAGNRVVHRCSACGEEFLLPDDVPPRAAVARMFAEFGAHLDREHPDARTAESMRRSRDN